MMCACEATFVCTRCAGTPHDWRYWLTDPADDDAERREHDRVESSRDVGITKDNR